MFQKGIEVRCEGDASGEIGGRDDTAAGAREVALDNGFHFHRTEDGERIFCPRCAAACPACSVSVLGRIGPRPKVEIRCDNPECRSLGGRDASEEHARELAWRNGFHSHVTRDEETMLCRRCSPSCPHCVAQEPPVASLPWELTVRCAGCPNPVRLMGSPIFTRGTLCADCQSQHMAVA